MCGWAYPTRDMQVAYQNIYLEAWQESDGSVIRLSASKMGDLLTARFVRQLPKELLQTNNHISANHLPSTSALEKRESQTSATLKIRHLPNGG